MNYFPEDDSVYEPAKNIIKYKRKKRNALRILLYFAFFGLLYFRN